MDTLLLLLLTASAYQRLNGQEWNLTLVNSTTDSNSTTETLTKATRTFYEQKYTPRLEETELYLKLVLMSYQNISQLLIESIEEASKNQANDQSDCKTKYDVASLTPSFEEQKMMLDMQVKQKILELKSKSAEISVTLMHLMALLKDKMSFCDMQQLESSKNCSAETENWYRGSLKEFSCRLIRPCKITEKEGLRCSLGEFKCSDGHCLDADRVCNGQKDCSDGSDETPGCKKVCLGGFHCGNLRCIEKSQVCDGSDDCGDNSDEDGCSGVGIRSIRSKRAIPTRMCNRGQYINAGVCIDIDSSTCDGSCSSGWLHVNGRIICRDEPSPNCKRYCPGGYHCGNLQCVELSQMCDGKDDCGDNTDEESCHLDESNQSNCSLESGKYLCSDRKKCIDIWMACDGKLDCEDGSDESGECGVRECGHDCAAAGGVCIATPKGRVCLSHCPPGTYETPRGCLPQTPQLSTLEELLDGIPDFVTKYNVDMRTLQARAFTRLRELKSGWALCKGFNYAYLSSVKVLNRYISTNTTKTKDTP